jgi:hypothetical protein
MASILMEKDLDESAQIFAFRDAKQSMVADPFAVSAQNHSYRMQEVASANASRERVAAINNAAADKRSKNTWDLSTGAYHYDTEKYIKDANGDDILNPNYNQVVPNESYSNTFSEFDDKDIATGEINVKNLSRTISQRQTDQYAVPYMQQSLALLDKLVTEGVMTKDQANKILHTEKDKTMTIEKFNKGLQGNSEYFLRNTVGTNSLTWINKKLNWWVKNNKSVSAITKDGIPGYSKANADFNNYIGYLDEDKKWRKDSSKLVEDKLLSQGQKYAKYLYKPDGTLRSEDEFYKVINVEGKPKPYNNWDAAKTLLFGDNWLEGSGQFGWGSMMKGTKQMIQDAATDIAASAKLKKHSGIYGDLVKAAGRAYSSSTMKKVPPGISSIGEMSGAGVFTPSRQSINVAPLAFGTKGNGYFHEFARDFRKIDFATSGISFHGTSSTKDTDAGKAMINAMISAMNDTKSKFKPFKMSSQAIAGGSGSKGAMILHPDAEWLQNYMKSEKGTAGLITADDYNAILTNGISVVSDSKNWTNGLYTSSYLDPLQSVVESNPNGYEWNDPYGNYNMKIKKNTMGTGDYNIQRTYRLLNQETGQYEEVSTLNNTSVIGNNLSNVQRGMFNESEEVRTYNQGY